MAANRKAQVSTEFLLILAASMLILIMIAILSQQQITTVQNQKDAMDTQNSLLDLSAAAREVYAQGEGSKKLVFIRLPSSYEPSYSFVGNKSIRIRVAGTDYVSIENFNVRGYLPSTPGGHWVWVVSEGNRVRIGLAMMDLNRNRIYVVMDSNTTASQSFSIKNVWIRDIDVETETTWTASDVDMGGVPASFQLATNDSTTITVQFSAGPTSGGFYTGEITLDASDGEGTTETTDVPVTVQVIRPGEAPPTIDTTGPIITSIYQEPTPAIKLQPLAIFVTVSDVLTGNSTITGCQIDADSSNNWQVMLPVDGAYDQTMETALYNYTSGFALGPHILRAKCTDYANNTGPTAYYYFNVSEADQLGPIVVEVHHTAYPTTLSNVSVGGIATDTYTGNSNIQFCNVKIDNGEWQNSTPEDGAWDSPTENFTYNVGTMPVGYHNVYHQCTDSLGNVGGIYNDTFGVVDVDLMLVLDRSGSMAWMVTNASNSTSVSTTNTGWTRLKNMTVTEKNGGVANLSVELRTNTSACTVSYEARINDVVVATGDTSSTSYTYLTSSINVTDFEEPYQVALYMKRTSNVSCIVYNRFLGLHQQPTKLAAAQDAAKTFLDISGNATYAGLASYSTSARTDETLAVMDPTNQQALKDAIDALVASGNTCIECGLKYGADELVSERGRPSATRVIVMLTDGVGNTGMDGHSCGTECSVAGAVYCRDRNVTVYTIGFGNDVDDVELTNIALLTHGEYYFAPNAETLRDIFMNIGK
ncbi:MAG: VWA domain-containing protein [Candidatus ainarchaeum sp.]|nr:VWA domain-containing protein [Candidatus ainarchaeum sp.]